MVYFNRSNIDIILLGLIGLAILFGLTLLYSANQFSYQLPLKQIIKGSMVIVFLVPLFYAEDHNIRDISIWLYVFSLILLLLVLYNGHTTKGAQRWLQILSIRFEPSEIVKVTLPMGLASMIHKTGIPVRSFPLALAIVMILVPFYLVLKQPDLGTGLLLLMIGTITVFIAGISRRFILITLLGIALLSPLLWHQLHGYQKQRIMTLFSETQDLKHHGYHINQSKIAIGSGGLWGKGYGKGSQVQLGYIPEHKTDFIFTLLSEELGFIGNIFWCLLLLSIGFRAIYLGHLQQQVFNKITVVVLGFSFMLSAWVNMSMVSGLLPVVGIPLPFLSYGGTNFVITLINFALILKLGHTDPRRQYLW